MRISDLVKVGDLVTINHRSWSELAGMVGIVLSIDPLYSTIHFSSLNKALCIGCGFYDNLEVINESR
mgnify:CR=1 FL=1